MFCSLWITAVFIHFFQTHSLVQASSEQEWEINQVLKSKSSRDLLTQAKCLSFCIHQVYPNQTNARCDKNCTQCAKACVPGFSNTEEDCKAKCKEKTICEKACRYKYFIDFNLQMTKQTTEVVSVTVTFQDVTLSWNKRIAAFKSYTPVYLIYIRPSDATVGQPVNKVLLSTKYSVSVTTLCAISKAFKAPEHEYYFTVIAVNGNEMDDFLYVSVTAEKELLKPRKIWSLAINTGPSRPPLYKEFKRLPSRWPAGDKIRIPVVWKPDPVDAKNISVYRFIVKEETNLTISQANLVVTKCGPHPGPLGGPPPNEDPLTICDGDELRHVFFIHEETAEGAMFQVSVSAISNCSVGPARTIKYRYPGCRAVRDYPPNKCNIQEKPPPGDLETRAVNNLEITTTGNTSVGSVALVNLKWKQPTYKYGHAKSYLVEWRVIGFSAKQSVTTTTSFAFSFRMSKPRESVDIKVTPRFFNKLIAGESTQALISIPPKPSKHVEPSSGLSKAAHFGIGFASLLIIVLVAIVVFCFLKRRNKKKSINSMCERSQNSMETKLEMTEDNIDHKTKGMMSPNEPDDQWEVDPNSLRILGELGHGAFGKVFKGILSGYKGRQLTGTSDGSSKSNSSSSGGKEKELLVAVKTLHKPDDVDQRREFFDEIAMMKSVGFHRNIVNLVGCCTITEPLCLIQEFVPCGDLLHYLRERRAAILKAKVQGDNHLRPGDPVASLREDESRFSTGSTHSNTLLMNNENSAGSVSLKEALSISSETPLTAADLISFAWQVSCGMEYISQKGLIHRDLAARNVLVGEKKTVKIADFGLTRKINEEHMYVTRKTKKLPLKWMAPEAIFDKVFTTQTDVWAYGVLLWEIATLGGSPYPLISNSNLLQRLKEGYRMERPEHCSDELYAVMKDCWEENPENRPTFTRIREELEEVMERDTPYLELQNMDPSSSYYVAMSGNSDTITGQEATS